MTVRTMFATFLVSVVLFSSFGLATTHAAAFEPKLTPTTKQPTVFTAKEIFEKVSPAVVRIEVRDRKLKSIGHGSGFFVSDDGLVVTNFHVIEGAFFVHVSTSDGTVYSLKGVEAFDKRADIAILRVAGNNLPALTLASVAPPVGTRVFAIGNPRGFINSISDGIVSGNRRLTDGLVFLQTTAAISAGSSGGPLLSENGEVVAVTTASVRGAQSLNLAVPARLVAKLLKQRKGLSPLTSIGSGELSKGEAKAMRKVWQAIDAHNPAAALRHLGVLRSTQGGSVGYWMACGEVHRNLNNHNIAVSAYQRAAKLAPDDWKPLVGLAEAHAANGNTTQALAIAQRAVLLGPEQSTLYEVLAERLMASGQAVQAGNAIETAITLDPHDWSSYYTRGTILEVFGDYKGAVAAIKRSLREFESSRIKTSERLGTYDRSLMMFHRKLSFLYKRLNDTGHAWYHAGLYSAHGWREDEAVASFARAVSLLPKPAAAHYHIGKVHSFFLHLSGGETFHPKAPTYNRIAAHFQRALSIAPDHADAHAAWAGLATQFRDYAVAIEHGRAALRKQPCAAHAITLARAYNRAGRRRDAQATLEKSTKAFPTVRGFLYLGDLYARGEAELRKGNVNGTVNPDVAFFFLDALKGLPEEQYRQAHILAPDDLTPWLRLIGRQHDDRAAELLCRKAMAEVSPVSWGYGLLGKKPRRRLRTMTLYKRLRDIYNARGDIEALIKLAAAVVALDTDYNEVVWMDLAESLKKANRDEEAAQSYRNAMAAAETFADTQELDRETRLLTQQQMYLGLFFIHWRNEQYELANTIMREAFAKSGNKGTLPLYGRMFDVLKYNVYPLIQKGQYAEANLFLDTWVDYAPTHPLQLQSLGLQDDTLIACLRGVQPRRVEVGAAITNRGIAFLSECKTIESLDIRRHRTDATSPDADCEQLIKIVSGFTKLRSLRLCCTGKMTINKKELLALAKSTHIWELDLSGSLLGQGAATALAAMPELRTIKLDGDTVTDEVCALFTQLPELRTLQLRSSAVTNRGLEHLSECTRLEELRLPKCKISDEGIEHLGALHSLHTLDLSRTPITDKALVRISTLGGLKFLDVGYTRVSLSALLKMYRERTSDDASAIRAALSAANGYAWVSGKGEVTRMKFGHVRLDEVVVKDLLESSPGLEYIELNGADVKDGWLENMKPLESLKELRLLGTDVGDDGVPYIAGIKTLVRLDLKGSKITDAGVAELKRALPNCKINK